jgi:membrane-associated phospholipid phosphatase
MVRRPPRFLAPVAIGAGLVYLALFVRALAVGSAAWEEDVVEWLYWHSERSQVAMDRILRLGEAGGPFLIVLLVVALFAARRRSASMLLLVGAGGAALLGLAAKGISDLLSSEALDFPSGQATGSAGLVAALVVLLFDHPRRLLIVLAAIASVGLYGLILVATNWHSPSEVAGGWFLALAWVSGVWLAARSIFGTGALSPPSRPELRGAGWDSRQQRGLEPRA